MLKLRFEEKSQQRPHAYCTLFFNGANVGTLTLEKAEAIWLNHILSKGCEACKFEMVSFGPGPDAPLQEVNKCAQLLAKPDK